MKQKGAIYYQLAAMKRPMGTFYLILVLLFCVMVIANAIFGSIGYGGVEVASMICIFVVGCCSFKEDFLFLIQSGVGRKTILTSQCLSYSLLCVGMAAADTILACGMTLISNALHFEGYHPLLVNSYLWEDGILGHIPVNFLLLMAAYLMLYSFGYLLAAMSYRGGKRVTICLSVGLPVTLFVLLPACIELGSGMGMLQWVLNVLLWLSVSYGRTIGALLIIAAVCFAIGGRLQLKAQVKA
ncbi:hypothetical protein [Hominifimenecus sp. rT4P-3]|uniref:hypothetical protein n=1 Tax=Hominifimenecus sp. rT4P-3 TaxID=3242979 RepID=UPI003DA2167D